MTQTHQGGFSHSATLLSRSYFFKRMKLSRWQHGTNPRTEKTVREPCHLHGAFSSPPFWTHLLLSRGRWSHSVLEIKKKKSSLPHWVRVPPRKLTEKRENKRHSLTHSRTLRYIVLGNVRGESVQTGLLYLHFLSLLSFWQQKFCSQMHFCLLPKVA